jgi:RNA polymerase sigma factor (sigma-70 family)
LAGRNLRALLAHAVAATGSGLAGVPDRELLRRYRHDQDDPAFAELVRRHARLVWAACRQQLPSDTDAEDAFQATFLALARNPGVVRDGNRLAPFLHGVAVRVCSKARRSAARRKAREQIAGRVGPGPAVPDSAWDAALAAVHAEAARLPEALRVPFVMCCLEGKGATEAADLLGWKLGTLSGRLTRAKQTVLDRLAARGLSAGAVVAAAAAVVPAGAVARAVEVTRPGVAVAEAVFTLSQGVVGMAAFRIKLAVVAVLVAGGLGTSVESGWLATADAQTPGSEKGVEKPGVGPGIQLPQAQQPPGSKFTIYDFNTPIAKWEYRYETFTQAGGNARPLSGEFEKLLEKAEADGWQFVGEVNLRVEAANVPNGYRGPALVFRRPVRAAQAVREARENQMAKLVQQALQPTSDPAEMLKILEKMRTAAGNDPEALAQLADMFRVIGERAQRPADVVPYLDRLYKLKPGEVLRTFTADEMPLSAGDMSNLLGQLGTKKFGDKQPDRIVDPYGRALIVRGSKEAVEWAAGVVKKLTEK